MTDDSTAPAPISLSVNSARVLGCLLEKEITVPASYPMTMNGLVTAANQTSGRDPIMSMTEAEIDTALAALRAFGLSRTIHAAHGARVVKYRQVGDELLGLARPERAVITVLLLRGPQTPGELRTRSDRIHAFGSGEDVEQVLRELTQRPNPLVELQARVSGQKEARWRHTLMPASAMPSPATAIPTAAPTVTTPIAAPPPSLTGTWVDGDEALVLVLDGDDLVVDTMIDGELFERRRWRRAHTPDE